MKKVMLILIPVLLAGGCSARVLHHDEDKAIDSANLFLKDLIKEDYVSAYDKHLADGLKKVLPFERFEADLRSAARIRGRLTKAIFDSYQPVPGQRAIQLYYNVSHEKAGAVLYHFVLEGDARVGYKVVVLDIGNKMQYPPNMTYVGVKRIKKDKDIEVTGD